MQASIGSFLDRDADRAREIIARDARVDELYAEFCDDMLSIAPEGADEFERHVHLLSVAKWLERIGDHGTNLAEQVVFLVKGKDIRHCGRLSSGTPR